MTKREWIDLLEGFEGNDEVKFYREDSGEVLREVCIDYVGYKKKVIRISDEDE